MNFIELGGRQNIFLMFGTQFVVITDIIQLNVYSFKGISMKK